MISITIKTNNPSMNSSRNGYDFLFICYSFAIHGAVTRGRLNHPVRPAWRQISEMSAP
jgi:hypothetical protein